ncbi:MAG TPA: tetratricopeptide repeat protein [Chitinophagales bacterium]|nr:tetratricopeptide repeat protein [Chitinophagales bacterium]HMX04102.1 tetratricopeptide repeat protein [Chitinophagales bacterium]HNA57130.1 tetratricopeptide repeat protein [Chitinophagales bacterium]HNE44648.1 tetratricopeptide repeat protein [Chitinophagales bacterium]HNF69327.1 tetratricopeptide repeat protein [Chitinophagales bacterium]
MCIVLCGTTGALKAQQSLIYTDLYANYKKAMELYENKMYATAQEYFEQVGSVTPEGTDGDIFTYVSNSRYYAAICAIELNNTDAEKMMLDFVHNNPGNVMLGSAYNQLGKLYYNKKEYTNAATWFEKVDVKDLSLEERDTYKFQYGYSLFNKKRFTEAKVMFASLKDKPQNQYYNAANYYYGFIQQEDGNYENALTCFNIVKDVPPYNAVVPYYITNIYFQQGKYEKVISYAEPLMADTKLVYFAEINSLIGQAYFYRNNYRKALPYLNYYIEKAKNIRDEDYYQLAFAQYSTGDSKAALTTLKETSDDNDTLYQHIQYLYGNCYIALDKKEEARNAFMEASRIGEDKTIHEQALFNYGKLSYESGYHTAAVTAMQDYLKAYPKGSNKTEAQELLANALLGTNDYLAAMDVIENIPQKTPKLKEAYQKVSYYSGVQLFNQKNFDEADKMFMQSLENPIDVNLQAACYFWIGEIRFAENKYALTITNHVKFQDLAKVAKDLPSETRVPYSDYTIGYAYFKQSNYSNAVNYFSKVTTALKTSKTDMVQNNVYIDASLRLGDCYFMTKDYKKAETNYNKIIDNNAKGVDYAMYQKAMLQGLQNNSNGKIATLQSLTNKYPNSLYVDDAMYEIANTYFITKKNTESIAAFKELVSEKPNSSYTIKAYLKLGLIYFNEKDYKNSEKYYRLAYESSPNSEEGQQAKEGLADIVKETGNTGAADGVVEVTKIDEEKYNYAKNKYDLNEFSGAAIAFSDYLREFPKGGYKSEAEFYRGESYYQLKQYAKALPDFESIIKGNKTKFLESALVRAGWIEYYQNEDYQTAYNYYERLYEVADFKENTFVAMVGLLQTAYFLNDFDAVIVNANRILASDLVTNKERIDAHYYSGQAHLANNNIDKAYDAFSKAAALTTNEIGVESRFHMADILFQKGKLEESKTKCNEIINNMPSYDEWIIRSYILLADIAAAKGDYAQAKATLNSIISGYKGDPELVELAKQKLEQIEEMEKSGRRKSPASDTNDESEINFDNN